MEREALASVLDELAENIHGLLGKTAIFLTKKQPRKFVKLPRLSNRLLCKILLMFVKSFLRKIEALEN